MDFRNTHVLAWRNWITAWITKLPWLSVADTIWLTLSRQEQTLDDHVYNGLQGNESCDATSHVRALRSSYICFLKCTEVTLQIALVCHGKWVHLNGAIHKFQSWVCISMCIFLLHLLGKAFAARKRLRKEEERQQYNCCTRRLVCHPCRIKGK
jgi:hypothetical protein